MKIFLILCILAIVGFGFYMWKKEGGIPLNPPSSGSGSMEQGEAQEDQNKGDNSLQSLLNASNTGTYAEVWENIKKNEQNIIDEVENGKRVSDALDKYDTLIPLYFTCKMTATPSEDVLRANIEKYLDLVARNREDPEYDLYTQFVSKKITMQELYTGILRIYQDSLTEFPMYANEAKNVIQVLQARLKGNYGDCSYTEAGIQI